MMNTTNRLDPNLSIERVKYLYDIIMSTYDSGEITLEEKLDSVDEIRALYPRAWEEILLEISGGGGTGMGGGGGDDDKLCGTSRQIESTDGVDPSAVIGMDQEKALIRTKFVLPLVYPRQIRSKSKKILLYGPPGTGKSYLAKALGNMIFNDLKIKIHGTSHIYKNEDKRNFAAPLTLLAPTGAELQSPYHGCTSKLMKKYFDEALKQNAILFVDEIDGYISASRGTADSGSAAVANQLLTLMSDRKYDNVIFVAATNYPEKMDGAFQRRFTTRIMVDLPSDDTRKKLIAYKVCEILQFDPDARGSQSYDFLSCSQTHMDQEKCPNGRHDCKAFKTVVDHITWLTGFFYDKILDEVDLVKQMGDKELLWKTNGDIQASFLNKNRTDVLHSDMNSKEEVKKVGLVVGRAFEDYKEFGKPFGYNNSDINDLMEEVGSLLGSKFLYEEKCLLKDQNDVYSLPDQFDDLCTSKMFNIEYMAKKENLSMIMDHIKIRESTVQTVDYHRLLEYDHRFGKVPKGENSSWWPSYLTWRRTETSPETKSN